MCSCHSIPEFCVMFSGVKLSMGSFILLNGKFALQIYQFYESEIVKTELKLM